MKKIGLALLLVSTVALGGYVPTPVARKTDGAVEIGAAVKASTTAGRVTKLLHTDSAVLMTGVAITASAGTGNTIQVMEVQGVQTPVVSDGTTTISPGDPVRPSDTVDGRFMKGVADSNTVCSATQSAVAVAGTLFNCL